MTEKVSIEGQKASMNNPSWKRALWEAERRKVEMGRVKKGWRQEKREEEERVHSEMLL